VPASIASLSVVQELQTAIDAIDQDAGLRNEHNFASRGRAIDAIEFRVLDRIDGLSGSAVPAAELALLRAQAEQLRTRLEDIDRALFQRLRQDIRLGTCRGAALLRLIDGFVDREAVGAKSLTEPGYDDLDAFVNGLLLAQPVPDATSEREPEMVFYQQTPARVILELANRAALTADDLFYDVGCGLGQVPILVHLLTGVPAIGVELEPAYCAFASQCAVDLNVHHVSFTHADARTADYAAGTVFFMYTPFEGGMLELVLTRLYHRARSRRIRLFTYGPCTRQVSRHGGFERIGGQHEDDEHELAEFVSV
jgi:hypothetical protein